MSNKLLVKTDKSKTVAKALRLMKGAKVGYLSETTGPKTPYDSGLNLATNALYQEYGTTREGKEHIPPRPFMRQGAKEFGKSKSEVGKSVKMGVMGDISPKSASTRIGVILQKKIRQQISSGSFKALAPSTVSSKGSSKPLIDTGALRQGVDVKEK